MTVVILNSIYEFSKYATDNKHIHIKALQDFYSLYGTEHVSVIANYDCLSNSEKPRLSITLLSHMFRIDNFYIIWRNPEPTMYNYLANKYPEVLI